MLTSQAQAWIMIGLTREISYHRYLYLYLWLNINDDIPVLGTDNNKSCRNVVGCRNTLDDLFRGVDKKYQWSPTRICSVELSLTTQELKNLRTTSCHT